LVKERRLEELPSFGRNFRKGLGFHLIINFLFKTLPLRFIPLRRKVILPFHYLGRIGLIHLRTFKG